MNDNYNQQNQQNQPYQQNQQFQQYPQHNMYPQQPQKESFFKKIHTNKFHWTDQFILISLLSYVLLIVGQLLGEIIVYGQGVMAFATNSL